MARNKVTGETAVKRFISWVKYTMGPLTHTQYYPNDQEIASYGRNGSMDSLQFKKEILELVYPVGSIYRSTVNNSPATFLGGEWVQIKDKFLMSESTSYTAGSTGGAKEVTLVRSDLPNVTGSTPSGEGAHGHIVYCEWGGTHDLVYNSTYYQFAGTSAVTRGNVDVIVKYTSNTHKHGFYINGNQTQTNIPLVPSYYAVYTWKRIS